MITGTVVISLQVDNSAADRRAVGDLYGLPDGIRVVVDVGSRTFVSDFVVDWLQQHADRVHYDVHGDVDAVRAWVSALRGRSSARWSA